MVGSPLGITSPQVLVVHSPAGGTGKTLLALLMAYMYADKGHRTVLVDLCQYGAVAPWLRIPRGAASGFARLLPDLRQGTLSDEAIHGSWVAAPEANDRLYVIPSSGAAKMDQVKAADVELLLSRLTHSNLVVIVDTGSELTDRVLGALVSATQVVLAVNPQVVAGWQALELLEILRTAYVKKDRLGAVFTRVEPGARFGVDEYVQTLDLPLLGTVPESVDLHKLSERGGPPAIRGKTPGIRAVRSLAHRLVPTFSPKELSGRWPWSR